MTTFTGKERIIKRVSRPTFLGMFLAFGTLFIGVWMVLNSLFRLFEVDSYGLTDVLRGKIDVTLRVGSGDPEQLNDPNVRANKKFAEEFSAGRLMDEASKAHYFRDRKIHHVAALVFGLANVVAGLIGVIGTRRAYHLSLSRLRGFGSAEVPVYKPPLSSRFMGWWAAVMGLVLIVPSTLALSELSRYSNGQWLAGLLNAFTMVHLADHYITLLLMGVPMFVMGVIAIPVHKLTFIKAQNKILKASTKK